MSGQIFISYRREDSSASAGRLYDRLSARLPKNQIFIDVDLDPGIDFVEAIEASVGSCDVLIAVIGKLKMPIESPKFDIVKAVLFYLIELIGKAS